MLDFQHNIKCLNLLIESCENTKQYSSFLNSISILQRDPSKYGLVDEYEAYMSADRYYNILQLISDPEEAIVVDCGCGEGLQQLLFQNCKKYIGIDIKSTPFVLTSNASFYLGNVKDILPRLEAEGEFRNGEVYCISVLAGMCFSDIKEAMYRFNKVINI